MVNRYNLKVIDEAHKLVLGIYRVSDLFPPSEVFGLASQMRRAAVSVPSNIIEGRTRTSKKEFSRYLSIARGSLEELKYQIILSRDLDYIELDQYELLSKEADIVGKLLFGLMESTKKV